MRCTALQGGAYKSEAKLIEEGVPTPLLGDDTREKCQARLLTLLAHASNRQQAASHAPAGKEKDKDAAAAATSAEPARNLVEEVCAECTRLETKSKTFSLLYQMGPEEKAVRQGARVRTWHRPDQRAQP